MSYVAYDNIDFQKYSSQVDSKINLMFDRLTSDEYSDLAFTDKEILQVYKIYESKILNDDVTADRLATQIRKDRKKQNRAARLSQQYFRFSFNYSFQESQK